MYILQYEVKTVNKCLWIHCVPECVTDQSLMICRNVFVCYSLLLALFNFFC